MIAVPHLAAPAGAVTAPGRAAAAPHPSPEHPVCGADASTRRPPGPWRIFHG
ncbi:hypothetical protein AB0L25_22595 [Spirillospora sp. NPDC052242]